MAFPTTAVIDTFNRVNESPLGTSSSGPAWSTTRIVDNTTVNVLKIVSNACFGAQTAGDQQYITTTYGPNCEAYVTMPVLEGAGLAMVLYIRIINPGSASASGYRLSVIANTTTWTLSRVDNAVNTTIATNTTQAFLAGDSYGIECIGSTITGYYKPSAGSWAAVSSLSATDATYAGAGVVGMQITNTVASADNFGGGTIASASTFTPRRALIGVGL